jgi:hypothetical protein
LQDTHAQTIVHIIVHIIVDIVASRISASRNKIDPPRFTVHHPEARSPVRDRARPVCPHAAGR